MPFDQNNKPEWNKADPKPAQSKLDEGWKAEERPPASIWNWFMNTTYKALKDLLENALHKEEKGAANGIATLGSDGKVISTQSRVASVNNKTGSVTISAADVGAETPTGAQEKATTAETNSKNYTDTKFSQVSYPVTSVNNKTGVISLSASDVGAASSEAFATHQADDVNHVKYGAAIGTANTYAVTLNPAPIAYVEGMAVAFKVPVASTAASTLNVNGLGAKGIKKSNGTDVTNLKAGGIYTVRYDGTSFILQGEGGEYGTALASDVRSTKTIGTENGVVQGTLNLTNLVPNNIRKGVTIDGVAGTLAEAGMDIPHSTNLAGKTVTGIDSDGNIYSVETSVYPNVGRKYNRNMVLLATYSEANNDIKGISKYGYSVKSGGDTANVTIKDLAGNVLCTFNSGTYYAPQYIQSVRSGQFAVLDVSTNSLYVWDFNGTLRINISISGDTKMTVNKKDNFVFMRFSAGFPYIIGRVSTSNAYTEIKEIGQSSAMFDMQNW